MSRPVFSDVHDTPPVLPRSRPLVWLATILRWLGLLLALICIAVAALWWWAGTDGSLATAAYWLQRGQPLEIRGASGSLRSGGRIAHLTWRESGLTAEADDVALAWQPLALLSGTLHLDHLTASRLRVDDQRTPAPAAPAPPTSLALPLRVTLANLEIERLEWGGSFQASALAGRYAFNGISHELVVRQVHAAGGHYRGEARLDARGDMALRARLSGSVASQGPKGTATLPLSFEASLTGSLADLHLKAMVQADTTIASARNAPPHATVSARITPWAQPPWVQADAAFRSLDLGALWPAAPHTELTGQVLVQPDSTAPAAWQIRATIDNAAAGPWDQRRLPLDRMVLDGEWRNGVSLVKQFTARLGGGELRATGQWTGATLSTPAWQLEGTLVHVDPALVHTALAGAPLEGQAHLQGTGTTVSFDARLRATRATPQTSSRSTGLGLERISVRGRWDTGYLSLPQLQVRARQATLDASAHIEPGTRAGTGTVALSAPGLRLTAKGALSERAGRGSVDLQASDVSLALPWLQQLPWAPVAARGAQAQGSAALVATWQGGWRDPRVQGQLDIPRLAWHAAPAAPAAILSGLHATVGGSLAAMEATLRGHIENGQRHASLRLSAQGGRAAAQAAGTPAPWQGQITQLAVDARDPALGPGKWTATLVGPVTLRWMPGTSMDVGPGAAALAAPAAKVSSGPTQIAWSGTRWQPGRLTNQGRVTGLPMAWLELLGGAQMAGASLAGDLVFDGEWDALLAEAPRLHAVLKRRSGDITVRAESADGSATRVAAGVRDADLTLDNQGDQLRLALRWDSERAGTVRGNLSTRLTRTDSGWQWPASAPLEGRVQAQLPRIGVWSLLAPPGWRLRGSVSTDLTVGGTRAVPGLSGTLQANDLALRSVVDGIEFRDGRLRVRLDQDRLLIDEFMLRGTGEQGGTLTAKGEAGWQRGQPRVELAAHLDRLRASIRTDRQITVSGDLQGRWSPAEIGVTGELRVDEASLLLPDEDTPRLGADVRVRTEDMAASGAKAPGKAAAGTEHKPQRTVTLAIRLDLGEHLRVQGHGLDTRLRGALQITGDSLAAPRLTGTVTTFGGRYRAYGQQLNVEQGLLRFTGPPDNPSLDILAIRPSMTQRVGVQITGSALLPRVRLYAQPDMPEAEKLSWLVLGRSSASGGAEAAVLQQAALALLGSRGGALSGGLAGSLGLDELSFRGAASQDDGSTSQGVVTLGKRFSSNFYVAYERSLASAIGTFYVFYDLTQRLTVRGQTGSQSAVDLIYTLQYD
ncbi:MAG: translocation/assembly module TamB domain-containing protein [Ramlibacter sp.]|nr:translocation/assembly module TamB domain-containing protein [Ramlibacter sp.]